MRRTIRVLTNVAALLMLFVTSTTVGHAANSVVVESKTISPGATGVTVGVYFTNDVCVNAITAPLEIRTVSGGAFPSANFSSSSGGRFSGANSAILNKKEDEDAGNACSGPTSKTWSTGGSNIDFDGRGAIRWSIGWTGGNNLAAGSDGSPGSGTPSIALTFDVSCEEGTFEIDTCCFASTHSAFSFCSGGGVTPTFTKGVITLDPGVQTCTCNDNPADVNCDGIINIVDYTIVYNVAFRGDPEPAGCCQGSAGTASIPMPSGGHDDR